MGLLRKAVLDKLKCITSHRYLCILFSYRQKKKQKKLNAKRKKEDVKEKDGKWLDGKLVHSLSSKKHKRAE